ncbi:MAG: anthranilate synthase component I family protein [Phycisphaeraceae bacterium]|nr:anthranilate synthase component I family protein [Phycisphaeraceae bacterium]
MIEPLDWSLDPGEALARWPLDRPVAVLWSGDEAAGSASKWGGWGSGPAGPGDRARGGWTILSPPSPLSQSLTVPPLGLSHSRSTTVPQPLQDLRAAWDSTVRVADGDEMGPDAPPFVGGWIGWLGYEFGELLEPAVAAGGAPMRANDRGWPLAQWYRCPAAYLYNHRTGRWCAAGEPAAIAALPRIGGSALPAPAPRGWRLGEIDAPPGAGTGGRGGRGGRYADDVARIVEYIRAGDIYQANLTHRLSAAFDGSARALFLALAAAARPRYGAYIEPPGRGPAEHRRIIASISPELFLDVGADGRVVTRPIKGTRPAGTEPAVLAASAKDQAELNMIIDLMRNDLGRVCRFGSILVDEARTIETHGGVGGSGRGGMGGVHHGVATVSGELRAGAGLADLLGAAFPAGSITGAPKIRAMQIIRDLEPVARGPYCGAIGYVSDGGGAAMNVAIRTAVITGNPAPGDAQDAIRGGVLDYGVGAGIVVQSDPRSEWEETLAKAGVIRRFAGREGGPGVPT